MSTIEKGRWAADTSEREFVCFLIGMRINRPLMPWKWMPVPAAMPKMIAELMRNPELGLRGRPRTFLSGRTILVMQYVEQFRVSRVLRPAPVIATAFRRGGPLTEPYATTERSASGTRPTS
jgi:hypothetical protein